MQYGGHYYTNNIPIGGAGGTHIIQGRGRYSFCLQNYTSPVFGIQLILSFCNVCFKCITRTFRGLSDRNIRIP